MPLIRVLAIAAAMLAPAAVQAQRPMRVPVVEPAPDVLKGDTVARSMRPRTWVGTFDGLVTDTTLAPLADAEVTVLRTSLKVRTGTNGRFRITQLPAGQYVIIVRRLGFHPASGILEVQPNDTLRYSYALVRAPQGLDTVHVATERRSLRMMEFDDRRKLGEGQFLTQEEIDRHNSVFVSDLVRFFFRGIKIKEGGGGKGSGGQIQEYATSSRGGGGAAMLGNPGNPQTQVIVPVDCYMKIVIDDVPMPAPFDLHLLPPPREIAGIELYTGPATLPVRFNGLDAWCGLILIWTKDG
jgi:hypothetical protein